MKDEGTPQLFEQVCSHKRKLTRTTENVAHQEWLKHLDELRSLSILANQATEFVYRKNLTEGKTGIIKPDLIPSELRGTVTAVTTSTATTTTIATTTTASTTYPSGSTSSTATSNLNPKLSQSIKDEEQQKNKDNDEQKSEVITNKAKISDTAQESKKNVVGEVDPARDRETTTSGISSTKNTEPVVAAKKTALNIPTVKTTQQEKPQEKQDKSPIKKILKAKPTEIKKAEPPKMNIKVIYSKMIYFNRIILQIDVCRHRQHPRPKNLVNWRKLPLQKSPKDPNRNRQPQN